MPIGFLFGSRVEIFPLGLLAHLGDLLLRLQVPMLGVLLVHVGARPAPVVAIAPLSLPLGPVSVCRSPLASVSLL